LLSLAKNVKPEIAFFQVSGKKTDYTEYYPFHNRRRNND